jgi:hypothetical protein
MVQKTPASGTAVLEDLQKALTAARELAQQLTDDPLLGRLLAVFRAMPMEDREPIVAILEREIAGRRLSRATEKPVGQSTHLNPNARLYVRAHSTRLDKRHFDYDEMVIADVRAMRIASMIRYVPEIYEAWKTALREAMDHVDERVRAVAEELLRDGLAAIAAARADEQAAEPEGGDADVSERTRKS